MNRKSGRKASRKSSSQTSKLPRSSLALAAAALAGAVVPLAAHSMEIDWRLKATVAGVADGGRDLGLNDADDTREAYLDATPWIHLQFDDNWAAFARVRLYAPTGDLLQSGDSNNNIGSSDDAFVGLKELWVEYGGLTSYPGEALRLGRQRIRNEDTQFFDQDIDAVRWIFDTTLLDADLGVAHQFDTYRTDDVDLPPEQKDRTYAFGSIGWDWAARQRMGLRVVHASDDNDLPAIGSAPDSGTRLTSGEQTWINLSFDNHPYDWQQIQPLSYWVSGTYLVGSRDRDVLGPADPVDPANPDATVVTSREDEDVKAWAGDAGLRVRLGGPVQAGIAYAYSSGADGDDAGKQYEQTGVQSNYSRFTGTRSQIYRFNEAFRPELGNLQAATAFVSVNGGVWDASVIYNNLRRPEADAPIVSDGLRVSPTVASHDLGQGVDLVLTRYFDFAHQSGDAPAYTPDDIGNSSLRLRGSWFEPGDAFGPEAKDDYRVLLEFTLWY